jgi:hypothetical protein
MYRHISTFPALSFAYGLVTHWSTFKVNIRQFSWEDSEFAQSGPGDNTLASCIKSNRDYLILLEKAFGTGAPQEYQSFLEDQEHFINLLSAANLAIDSAAPLYTKDSAKSFHRFLFATLIMYARSLNSLCHCAKKKLTMDEEQEFICQAREFTRILTNVLCSSSFEWHMRVITVDGKYL